MSEFVRIGAVLGLVLSAFCLGWGFSCSPRQGLDSGAGGTSGNVEGSGGSPLGGASGEGVHGDGGKGGATSPSSLGLRFPPSLQWLDSSEIWTPITGVEASDCVLLNGDPKRLEFPKLVWEECGVGCSRADVVQGFGSGVVKPVLGTRMIDGRDVPLFYLTVGLRSGDRGVTFRRHVDLDSGETLSATLIHRDIDSNTDPCHSWPFPRNVASLYLRVRVDGDDDEARSYTFGHLTADGMYWRSPWVEGTPPVQTCGTVGSVGRVYFECVNSVHVMLDSATNEVSMISSTSDSNIWASAALGERFVWSENHLDEFRTRVRMWSQEAGVHDLIPLLPGYNRGLGISRTRIAGIRGLYDAGSEFMLKGSLWWAELPDSNEAVSFSASPEISLPFYPTSIVATWGDYLATEVLFDSPESSPRFDRSFLLLSRLSDWHVRKLDRFPSHILPDGGFTLTSKYLYVAQAEIDNFGTPRLYFVYRYYLAAFESIGEPLDLAD